MAIAVVSGSARLYSWRDGAHVPMRRRKAHGEGAEVSHRYEQQHHSRETRACFPEAPDGSNCWWSEGQHETARPQVSPGQVRQDHHWRRHGGRDAVRRFHNHDPFAWRCRAQGLSVGKSRLEEDLIPAAAELMEEAKARGVDLIIPRTCLVADAVAEGAAEDEVDSSAIPDTWAGVDVGHASIEEEIKPAVADANTIVWNGPMGVFEIPAFAKGTFAVAHMLAERTNAGATTIIGGGDSVAAVEK
eukprot:scaffold2448_cov250-Pinguiococcus_pyrenoidosus.AAC.2